MRYAVVTVSDSAYRQGTLVLFYSFLNNNPWFEGDMVVISDEDFQLRVDDHSVKAIQVSHELKKQLVDLVAALPHLQGTIKRLYSIEAFRLHQYDKVLFMDSDMLCKGSLRLLFNMEHPFAASPDVSYYEGMGRSKRTFQKLERESDNTYANVFNAGLLLLSPGKLQGKYEQIIATVTSDFFREITTGHMDQAVLNMTFDQNVHNLGPEYNFLLGREPQIEKKTGVNADKALIWHYLRHPKPWKLKQLLKAKLRNQVIPPEIVEWQHIYRAALNDGGKRFDLSTVYNRIVSKIVAP